jgi:hypothetical protein
MTSANSRARESTEMSASEREDTRILHGPKPEEEWTEAERWDSLSELEAYDYVPFSPASIDHDERFRSVEARHIWFWTVFESMEAVVREWPS